MEPERPTLLIVDDSAANIQILYSILQGDYDILFATDGARALELACERRLDLVLLDVMMPAMDGHEVCRRLKADPATAEVPVIFVTAMGEVEDEERGLVLGAVDYITKPVSPAIVRARVATHLRLKRQADLLRRLSFTDGLTGVANRRRFDQAVGEEWQRCARSGRPLSLLLADVDHFKRYNDRYGHLAGDDALRAVAGALARTSARPGDLVARYGGEELVCLLPETDAAGARNVAERMRAAVAGLGMEHAGNGDAGHVTVSIGAATALPGAAGDAQMLLAAADAALYEAKRGGRDRVAAASVAATADEV